MKTTKSQKRAKAKATPKKTVKAVTKTHKPRAKKGKGFKLEAKPLTEAQIKLFLEHFEKNGSFPGSKIPCNITGKLTTCVGPWLKKKVAEFGGAENLLRKYICRGAVKKHKEAQKAPSKRKASKKALKAMKVDEKVWDLPKLDLNALPLPLNSTEISDLTYSTCLRPDLHLDNDYACNGCEFFEACTSRKKCINKKLGLVATRKVRKAA